MEKIRERIFNAVKLVPFGKVVTVGEVARFSCCKINTRKILEILRTCEKSDNVPCHRVVNNKGEVDKQFVFGGKKGQRELLLEEGVNVDRYNVDLTVYGFYFW